MFRQNCVLKFYLQTISKIQLKNLFDKVYFLNFYQMKFVYLMYVEGDKIKLHNCEFE